MCLGSQLRLGGEFTGNKNLTYTFIPPNKWNVLFEAFRFKVPNAPLPLYHPAAYSTATLCPLMGLESTNGSRAGSYRWRRTHNEIPLSRQGLVKWLGISNGLNLGHMPSLGQELRDSADRAGEHPFPVQVTSSPSTTPSLSNGQWFPRMPRALKFTSPAATCAVSGLSLRHVSLQPLQVRSELQQSSCVWGDPHTNGGLGMVGSAPTSYALKTYARWFLKGFATKILFQKEGLTLAFQTR